MMAVHDATRAQLTAADPLSSTWLSANAGSGKTRVLTDRVARLLLDGVSPQNILCLTFTKAAAGEMQNRLFQRLGRWTMLDDATLNAKLMEIGDSRPRTAADIADARTLFARAIETPGGLKIQTIHSFCAALLRRFPLEAGVSPQFTEIDDRSKKMLLDEIMQSIADRPDTSVFDGFARYYTDTDMARFLEDVIGQKENFDFTLTHEDIWDRLGLRSGYCKSDLLTEVFSPSDGAMLEQLRSVLSTKEKNDLKAGQKLAGLSLNTPNYKTLTVLEDICLTGASAKAPFSAKVGSFPTKNTAGSLPFIDALNALMLRVEAARETRLTLIAAERTAALYSFAQALIGEYETRKFERGFLDFDDLIKKTKTLLSDPAVAAWVLYKLDGGIDHMLVDEAQDTSPDQWEIVRLLTDEFTSGQGARTDETRTIFVVGDKKQSIYSFQGADPSEFDRMRNYFKTQLEQLERNFQDADLLYSFRSSAAVLDTVDAVFTADSGLKTKPHHIAFKSDLPGRVDIWPPFVKPEGQDKTHWTSPLDEVGSEHQDKRLAQSVAKSIKAMINTETLTQIDQDGTAFHRKITAGDILILVRGRQSLLYNELHSSLRAAGVPVAGADRMKISGDLAVKDLRSLLAFLATPEDSLALAEALRSPIFGWSEQDLFDLAHGRSAKFLWREMENRKVDFPTTHRQLTDLRDKSDFLRPFDLIEYILINLAGRKNLLARLGHEANEAIDALLGQAMSYERNAVPNLTGFLTWLDADDLEIKRQMDQVGDQVRIMTIHGAKGLEAPIVILPETEPHVRKSRSGPLAHNDLVVWRPNAADMPSQLTKTVEQNQLKEAEERDRLLYVALTRAESWVIVAAADATWTGDKPSWHTSVEMAVKSLGAIPLITPNGEGLRYQTGAWVKGDLRETPNVETSSPDLPTYASQICETPTRVEDQLINPSNLGGAKAMAGEYDAGGIDPLLYGTVVHKLLEDLPAIAPSAWPAHQSTIAEYAFADTAWAEAIAVLNDPALSHIFAKDALAEVNLSATLPAMESAPMYGTVDRLLVQGDTVIAVDFKTNRVVPQTADQTPIGLLRQMGAYAQSLQAIFPDHQIQTAILWTKTRQLMTLPHHIVIEALENATTS